jgi:tRNA dimethylallyltransferase
VGADPFDGAVVLCGPTAAGKSGLAVELAERLDAEILGADSQQVYRGVAIGTTQPSSELQARVRHHLIGFVAPPMRMTAAAYSELAAEAARDIRSRGKRVLICGGTGLYLRAALEGLFEAPAVDPELRRTLEAEAARLGRDALHARLAAVDPATAARLFPNDLVRVVRALEIFEQTGVPLSQQLASQERRSPRVTWLGVEAPKLELNRRIDERTARLYREGLLDEARWLVSEGLLGWAPASSLGYRDAFAQLDGRLTLEEAMARTVRDTQRYAKRQRTWFRALSDVRWLPWPATVESALANLDKPA